MNRMSLKDNWFKIKTSEIGMFRFPNPKISWQRYTLCKDELSLTYVNALGKNYKQSLHINDTQKPMVMNLPSCQKNSSQKPAKFIEQK